MKERPILFSAPMVRALLAGTKTQTRRVVNGVKHFPEWGSAVGMVGGAWRYGSPAGLGLSDRGDHWSVTLDADQLRRMCTREAYGWGARSGCPYGVAGDRLWVRESWQAEQRWDWTPPRDIAAGSPIYFEFGDEAVPACAGRKRPSIHMPRWASRITLEVAEVRVERLQDISEADARAEGVVWEQGQTAVNVFESLWDEINGAGSWQANPWVWAVSFRRITQ